MRYKVLFSYNLSILEELVAARLQDGWKLQGGASVAQSDYYSENHKGGASDNFNQIFLQAMTYEG